MHAPVDGGKPSGIVRGQSAALALIARRRGQTIDRSPSTLLKAPFSRERLIWNHETMAM